MRKKASCTASSAPVESLSTRQAVRYAGAYHDFIHCSSPSVSRVARFTAPPSVEIPHP